LSVAFDPFSIITGKLLSRDMMGGTKIFYKLKLARRYLGFCPLIFLENGDPTLNNDLMGVEHSVLLWY
jgi:hypothetical protein